MIMATKEEILTHKLLLFIASQITILTADRLKEVNLLNNVTKKLTSLAEQVDEECQTTLVE